MNISKQKNITLRDKSWDYVKDLQREVFKKKKLVLAFLGLHCCTQSFSSCGEWGCSLVALCWLLFAAASFVVEHGVWGCGL